MRAFILLGLLCSAFLENAQSQSYTISTLAGAPRLRDGATATSAPLRAPIAVALDAKGNLYIADQTDNRIRKVDTSGIISTYAGTGVPGYSGDRGPAMQAQLNFPSSIALDTKGNMYIADEFNAVVRRISADGTMNTIAGNGNPKYAGDNGPAASAQIDPTAVAVDNQGNLYIADGANYRVRKVDTNGIITTIAGNGSIGYIGDNGPATSAQVSLVTDLAVDNSGNLYIADYYNYEVRKIDAHGMITDFAGGPLANQGGEGIPATSASMAPDGVAFDGTGSIYISDSNVYNTVVRRVDLSTGLIYTVAGSGQVGFSGDLGVAVNAELGYPAGLAIANGVVYFADQTNGRVRRVQNNIITTVAGTSNGDQGPATQSYLDLPEGLAVDSNGNILVADTGTSEARKFQAGANISAAGQLAGGAPFGVAADRAGNFYVSDEEPGIPNETPHILKLGLDGSTTIIAGNGPDGFAGDGEQAISAILNMPRGLAVDAAGDIFVADYGNHRVRKIDTTGSINTIAGNGSARYSGDDGPALSAGMDPIDVAVDHAGNVFVVDQLNNRIRKIGLDNTVTTVAGTGIGGYSGDGGLATAAQLSMPAGIAVDGAGNLYIADEANAVIRRVTSPGLITTIAGNGHLTPSTGDGGPATAAQLDPYGIAVDAAGNVYVADSFNDHVRMLTPQVMKAVTMSVVSGSGQESMVGTTLAAPLVLKVVDNTGVGVPGVVVNLSVSPEGAATVTPSPAITLNDGTVTANVTLGSNAGPITITASGNGLSSITFALTAFPSNAPAISGGVVSAGLSNPSVNVMSAGAIVSIFGTNFAPSGTAKQAALVNGQLPTNLAGTCVEFQTVRAPIFALYPTQINVQVPAVTTGNVAVQVITGCDTPQSVASPPVSVAAQSEAPEFFYFTTAGTGGHPVAAIDAVSGAYIGAAGLIRGATFTPAKPSEYLTLFATGLGATNPTVAPGVLPKGNEKVTAPVTIQFGGVTLAPSDILYAGLSQFAGLYQVNIHVPANVPSGDEPLVITVGGVASPGSAFITVQNEPSQQPAAVHSSRRISSGF